MKKVDKVTFDSWVTHSKSIKHHIKYIDGKAVKAVILCIDNTTDKQAEIIDTVENGVMCATAPCHIFGFSSYSRVERLVRFEGKSSSDCIKFNDEPADHPLEFLKECVIPRMDPSTSWMYGMVHIEIDNNNILIPNVSVLIEGEVLVVWNDKVAKEDIPPTAYTIHLSP